MKILHLVLLTSLTAMGFINAPAQTADEIINKYINAMGGRDKLSSLKTIYTENELNIMNNPALGKTYLVNGKGYKSETDFNGQKIIDCYTVDSGWSINPLMGITTAINMPASRVKVGQLQLYAAGPLYDYAAKGSKAELLGKDEGVIFSAKDSSLIRTASYKLKLTTATGIEINFYIDSATNYILKQVMKINADGQDIEITTVNSDYRKTSDGFVMPFSQEITFPGLTFTITTRQMEINTEIDPDVFNKPKS